jgi:polyisoprenoid-binding protein YceI
MTNPEQTMLSTRKTSLLLLGALLVSTSSLAQPFDYEYDTAHSSVGFSIVHLAVSKVAGRFDDVSVTAKLDPSDISTLETEAVMQVASINTNHEKRDADLQAEDFFAAESFPEASFKSTGVSDVGEDGTFRLHGDLTIRDVTRPVVLDAEMRGPVEVRGSERLGFSATAEIDRFDYGLKWNALTEAGGLVAGREVTLVIEVELKRSL